MPRHVEAQSASRVVVDVHLGDHDLVGVLGRDLVEHRRDHLARDRTIPPEIEEDRAWGIEHVLLELESVTWMIC